MEVPTKILTATPRKRSGRQYGTTNYHGMENRNRNYDAFAPDLDANVTNVSGLSSRSKFVHNSRICHCYSDLCLIS